MQMFTEEELATGAEGLIVRDVLIGLQMINKVINADRIREQELEILSEYRRHLLASMESTIGKNYDKVMAEATLAANQAAMQQQNTAENEPQTEETSEK